MMCEIINPEKAAGLFGTWEETIIYSCLQGVMGKLIAPKNENPISVFAEVGAFRIFAGEADRDLVMYPLSKDFTVMVPQNERWAELIEECYHDAAKRVTRYAIKKDTVFDKKLLKRIAASAPKEYSFSFIDGELYDDCLKNKWSEDFVSSYGSKEEFLKKGLGVVATKDGKIVSGASSYSSYREGIEIEVDTREDHRRRHLAAACSARLILECLRRGLYPSWDAQNMWSVNLAVKLGYEFSHEYTAYEVDMSQDCRA